MLAPMGVQGTGVKNMCILRSIEAEVHTWLRFRIF